MVRDPRPYPQRRDLRRGVGNPGACAIAQGLREGRWRKRKGIADIRLPDGTQCRAELHWYEAAGIGHKEIKIKRFLE